jgi:tRNA modification GTPase
VSDTCLSLLTPPGKAALATLALSGVHAWEIARDLFKPIRGSALPQIPEVGRFWLGRLGNEKSEEGVLAVRGIEPPRIELHVHGGPEVVRFVFELFAARGAVLVPWEDVLSQHEEDPLRRQAASSLALTSTTRTASILLDQYQGALRRYLKQVEQRIIAREYVAAREMLNDLLQLANLGRHLTTPWRVVIAGAPNVGKSSLLNALAGYQRSVVAPLPGTTRDVVSVRLAIDGWPVEVLDTAGVRSAHARIEQLGIELAEAAAADADLVLWVLDASQPPVWPTMPSVRIRLVVSKIDLPVVWDLSRAPDALQTSSTTGQGMADLAGTLSRWLVKTVLPPGAAVPFTEQVTERLTEALRLLEQSADSASNRTIELLSG